jgi:outer membrane protein TolC
MLDELERLVAQRQRTLDSLSNSASTSQTLETLEAELAYLESTAESIDTFDSDLTFSTSYEVEDQIFKAGVTVNLSPSNWNNEKKLDSALDISMQQQEIEQAQATLALQVQLQQQRVKLETESVQVAQLGVEQQVRNLEEAEYLLELGERTALEIAEQKLVLSEAQLTYIKALYSLMDAQQIMSRFFPS